MKQTPEDKKLLESIKKWRDDCVAHYIMGPREMLVKWTWHYDPKSKFLKHTVDLIQKRGKIYFPSNVRLNFCLKDYEDGYDKTYEERLIEMYER